MERKKSIQPGWLSKLRPYETPSLIKSWIQIGTSLIAYLVLMSSMIILVRNDHPYWIVFLISVVTAGFYTRVFIVFHDCCHYSFFKSRSACTILGNICGIVTFTSYTDWQRSHNVHHSTVSNLDRRGAGDVWTMTADEYKSSGILKKLQYRIMRNPFFLFGIGPSFLFLILNRFPGKSSRKKEVLNLIFTNTVIASLIALIYFTIGIKHYLLVQAPVTVIGSTFGMWLFYIQHQYENVYWDNEKNWDIFKAAMEGSSYYDLPPVLRWFSGNIGYHHIHHLRPKIPNYNLQPCFENIEELQKITPITLRESFKSLRLCLWDESKKQLISFSALKENRAAAGG